MSPYRTQAERHVAPWRVTRWQKLLVKGWRHVIPLAAAFLCVGSALAVVAGRGHWAVAVLSASFTILCVFGIGPPARQPAKFESDSST